MTNSRPFKLFGEGDADDVYRQRIEEMARHVRDETPDYLLNVGIETYAAHLIDQYAMGDVVLLFDQVSLSDSEANIPTHELPAGFDRRSGGMTRVKIVRYHIPFEGTVELLGHRPNPYILFTHGVRIEGTEVVFQVRDYYGTKEGIESQAQPIFNNIATQYKSLKKQLADFSQRFPAEVRRCIEMRKQGLLERRKVLASLDIPVKATKQTSGTFAVPVMPRKVKIGTPKPQPQQTSYEPEPTLNSVVYEEILQLVTDVGKQFERMPSTYVGKDEESLRDHFLLFLETNFVGSATGETFNKSGKTDILLRHDSSNVFVAECKYWEGVQKYRAAITQLISYLTWRDSKSAVILFVKNKDFSSVLEKMQLATPEHSNYLTTVRQHGETRFDYKFHLDGDPSREIQVAVLLFHFPPPNVQE